MRRKIRVGALLLVLLVVLAASALNLLLGGLWVLAVVVLARLRRRVAPAAWMTLAAAIVAAVAGVQLDLLGRPPPASYAVDELDWLRAQLPEVRGVISSGLDTPLEVTRARLRARLASGRAEERGHADGDLARLAAAQVAAGRDLGVLREGVPRELASLEEGIRRLALTLTSPSFRDLDLRRARLEEWLVEVDVQLRMAPDMAALESAARSLDPAAMARVSFRALAEDTAGVDAAMKALVRAVGGGEVRARATSRASWDEARRELVVEDRYVLETAPPLGIRWVDVRPLRAGRREGGVSQTVTYAVDEGEPQPAPNGPEITLAAPASRVVLTDRRARSVAPEAVRAPLRSLAFDRIVLAPPPVPAGSLTAAVAVGGAAGPSAVVVLAAGPPRLTDVALPRHAFHHASEPGQIERGDERDRWIPAEPWPMTGPLVLELVPATPLLRHRAFAELRPYLYTPSLTLGLAVVTLAALTRLLVGRRPAPHLPAGGLPGPRSGPGR